MPIFSRKQDRPDSSLRNLSIKGLTGQQEVKIYLEKGPQF